MRKTCGIAESDFPKIFNGLVVEVQRPALQIALLETRLVLHRWLEFTKNPLCQIRGHLVFHRTELEISYPFKIPFPLWKTTRPV